MLDSEKNGMDGLGEPVKPEFEAEGGAPSRDEALTEAPENAPSPDEAAAEAPENAPSRGEALTEAPENAPSPDGAAAEAPERAAVGERKAPLEGVVIVGEGEAEVARNARRARVKKEAREWVVSIAVALIAVFLIRSFLFTVIRVDGSSMIDTLHDGERLIVTVLDVKLKGVERGDVVICHFPGRTGLFGIKENFVKRVIGVEGDKIVMLSGVTYINGEAVGEPFVHYPSPFINGAWEIPEGYVFVCGDNRAGSHDSRSADVGPIKQSEIVGKVRLVMWPPSNWRAVE